jgi:hypothetical protein
LVVDGSVAEGSVGCVGIEEPAAELNEVDELRLAVFLRSQMQKPTA